jgi:DNA polymerase-1
MLGHLSGDEGLIAAFQRGEDIHVAVASQVFGVAPGAVTPAQRDAAKMVNFGIIYGITAFGLSRRLGPEVSREQAARFIADYKARYPRINEFLERCVEQARTQGYVETILGRRRPIPQVLARDPGQRALGERMAINSVVQGSAADLIKLAMIDLYRTLPGQFPSARMLLQIHDELVFEGPREQAEALRAFVAGRMEKAMDLRVPLKVGSAWSTAWIDVK